VRNVRLLQSCGEHIRAQAVDINEEEVINFHCVFVFSILSLSKGAAFVVPSISTGSMRFIAVM
jgi:hypothetical protein